MDMNSKVTNSVGMLIIPTYNFHTYMYVCACNTKFTCTVPVCCSCILTCTIFTFPLHTHTCTHTCAHACTHACAHTHAHTHTHRYTSKAFRYVDVPVYELFILVHTCTDQNVMYTHHTHTHTHVHICMHTHTNTLAGLKLASRLNRAYNLHTTFHLFVLAYIHDRVHTQRSHRYVAYYSIWYTPTCIYTNSHVHAHTYSRCTHLFFRFAFFSRSGNPFLSFLAVPHA